MSLNRNMTKNQHLLIGQWGERLIQQKYESQGYRTLNKNIRKPFGEIDLIVYKDSSIRFVEIKTRVERSDSLFNTRNPIFKPDYAVSREKKRKLKKVIKWYLYDNSPFHMKRSSENKINFIHVDIASVRVRSDLRRVKIRIIPSITL